MARVQTHLNLREMREQLAREKRLVDQLLDNMLPADAVRELKATGKVAPQRFENVAVLFVDLVSFTSYCDRHTPEEVVGSLGDPFILFEECANRKWTGEDQDRWRCVSRDSGSAEASTGSTPSGGELRCGDCSGHYGDCGMAGRSGPAFTVDRLWPAS